MDEFAVGEFVHLQNENIGERMLPRRSYNPLFSRKGFNMPENTLELGPKLGTRRNRGPIPGNGTLFLAAHTQSDGVREPRGPGLASVPWRAFCSRPSPDTRPSRYAGARSFGDRHPYASSP